jgi:hypothetical protein
MWICYPFHSLAFSPLDHTVHEYMEACGENVAKLLQLRKSHTTAISLACALSDAILPPGFKVEACLHDRFMTIGTGSKLGKDIRRAFDLRAKLHHTQYELRQKKDLAAFSADTNPDTNPALVECHTALQVHGHPPRLT